MTSSQEDTQMNQFNPATGHKCRQATVVSAYYQGETRIQVACSPAEVYALVSDVTRMGEWSPECYCCEWLGGATGPQVGVRFRGYNQWGEMRWARTATITVAAPGEEFAFTTIAEPEFPDSTDWCYRFEVRESGTLVMESCVLTENQWPPDMQAMIAEHGLGVQQRIQQSRERQVPAGDCLTVLAEIRRAKSRFGLRAAARVGGRRCATYAWIHRRTGGESALWL